MPSTSVLSALPSVVRMMILLPSTRWLTGRTAGRARAVNTTRPNGTLASSRRDSALGSSASSRPVTGASFAGLPVIVPGGRESIRPGGGPPDQPVHRDPPRDVPQPGDERDQEQQQGGQAGQVDGPDVHAG